MSVGIRAQEIGAAHTSPLRGHRWRYNMLAARRSPHALVEESATVTTREGVRLEVKFTFEREDLSVGLPDRYTINSAEVDLSDSQTRTSLEDLLEAVRGEL